MLEEVGVARVGRVRLRAGSRRLHLRLDDRPRHADVHRACETVPGERLRSRYADVFGRLVNVN